MTRSLPRRSALHRIHIPLIAIAALIAAMTAGATAANADDAPTGTVSGYVLNASNDAPIAGADIEVRTGYDMSDTSVPATTDGDGHFEVELPYGGSGPSYSVSATGFGTFGDSFTALTEEDPDVELTIRLTAKDASISGIVTDAATHAPIADANVDFYGLYDSESATSGPDGAYEIAQVAAGSYFAIVAADGYLDASFTAVVVSSGENVKLDAGLIAANAALTGRVVDDHGDGIPDLSVSGVPAGKTSPYISGSTDSDGYYTIEGLGAGEWVISTGGLAGGPDGNGDYWIGQQRTVTMIADDTITENFSLLPLRFGSISGYAYDASGDALEGICVLIIDPATGDIVTAAGGIWGTGSDGYFESAEIPVGTHTILFWDCGNLGGTDAFAVGYLGDSASRGHADTFTVGDGELVSGLDAHLSPGGSISGTAQVATPDGAAPLPGERIATVRPNLYQEVDGSWEQIYYDNPFFGLDEGYLMVGLPAGEICVGFVDANTGPRAFSPVFIDEATDCDDADPITITPGEVVENLTALLRIPRPGFEATAVDAFDSAPAGGIDSEDEVEQGGSTTIEVGSEHAGEWMSAFGHSVPTPFGDWYQVSSTGTITANVPASLPAGEHSLVIQDADGRVVGWNPVTVLAASSGSGGGSAGGAGGGTAGTGSGRAAGTTHFGETTTVKVWTLTEIAERFGADTESLLRRYLAETGQAAPPDLSSLIAAGGGDGLDLSAFDAWLTWSGADTTVELWGYSSPSLLGRFPVVDGNVIVEGVDLASLGSGEHHVLMVGEQSGSWTVATLTVEEAAAAAPAPPTEVTDEPASAADTAPDSGTDAVWLWAIPVAVLLAFVAILTVVMLRRRSS